MLKLAYRGLLEKKIRFTLTALAVVIGVTFVVGVFGLTDSLRSSFNDLAVKLTSGTDLTIRKAQNIGDDIDRESIPETIAAEAAQIPGVGEVIPQIAAFNVVITNDAGEPIQPNGPPALGFSFAPNQFFIVNNTADTVASATNNSPTNDSAADTTAADTVDSPVNTTATSRRPLRPNEFAVDTTTAADNDLKLGNVYKISGPRTVQDFLLVGLFNFGSPDNNSSLGQTMTAFSLATAQDFLGFHSSFLTIDILLEPSASPENVKKLLELQLGSEYEVITREEATAEQTAEFNEFIDIFGVVLLVFAFITVFVSAFIINNTFQIVLGQRVREIGLWRAIGATPRQVSVVIIAESILVGVFSTLIGTPLGLGMTFLMRELMRRFGFALPTGDVQLHPRTVMFAVLVGLGVTVSASVIPAWRARSIPPIAALGHGLSVAQSSIPRKSLTLGTALSLTGLLSIIIGMFTDLSTQLTLMLIGFGAPLAFIGVNVLSQTFAEPAVGILGFPIRKWFKVSGRLASRNTTRDPRRTASTAGAMMIGLTLMGVSSVVGTSVQHTFIELLEENVTADYFVESAENSFDPTSGFPEQIADDLAQLPQIESVVSYRFAPDSAQISTSTQTSDRTQNPARAQTSALNSTQIPDRAQTPTLNPPGITVNLLATELNLVANHIDGDIISGELTSVDPRTSSALHVDIADELGVSTGDIVSFTFPDDTTESLTVAAIYADSTVYGDSIIDVVLWDEHFTRRSVSFVSANLVEWDPQQSAAANYENYDGWLAGSREAVEEVLVQYPSATARNREEFRENRVSQLNSFLLVITVFLALSLVIAVVGITNTLALSVFERTREIGVLRSVGMTRKQLRRVIRLEAIIIAVFGALLGVSLGVALGVVATTAIPATILSTIHIPIGRLLVYVAISAVAGILAAIIPSYRASSMKVLDAIAQGSPN